MELFLVHLLLYLPPGFKFKFMHCMHFDYTADMFRNTSQKQRLFPYKTLSTYISFILVIRK